LALSADTIKCAVAPTEIRRPTGESDIFHSEGAEDGRKALSEHEVQAGVVREKTARLKALRSAKEAAAKANPGK